MDTTLSTSEFLIIKITSKIQIKRKIKGSHHCKAFLNSMHPQRSTQLYHTLSKMS